MTNCTIKTLWEDIEQWSWSNCGAEETATSIGIVLGLIGLTWRMWLAQRTDTRESNANRRAEEHAERDRRKESSRRFAECVKIVLGGSSEGGLDDAIKADALEEMKEIADGEPERFLARLGKVIEKLQPEEVAGEGSRRTRSPGLEKAAEGIMNEAREEIKRRISTRVGVAKQREVGERIEFWKQRDGKVHGKILAGGMTYEEALQRAMKEGIRRKGIVNKGGIPDHSREWVVYLVEGDKGKERGNIPDGSGPDDQESNMGLEDEIMACRVGMAKAANVQERIEYWKRHEGHPYSQILHRNKTYDEATRLEQVEARQRKCRSSAGGPRDHARDWCVYHVWGGR